MSNLHLLILATTVTVGCLFVVVWTAQMLLERARDRARLIAVILIVIYVAGIIFQPSAWPIINFEVLIGAVGAAVLIGGGLSSTGAVIAFLVTAAAVDVLSVSGGLSRFIIEGYQDGTSDLLLYLTLVVPYAGLLIPVVGISDLIIGGSAALALIRLGFIPAAVIGAIALGLLGALAFGILRGAAPALPFIAVASLILIGLSGAFRARHGDGAPTA